MTGREFLIASEIKEMYLLQAIEGGYQGGPGDR